MIIGQEEPVRADEKSGSCASLLALPRMELDSDCGGPNTVNDTRHRLAERIERSVARIGSFRTGTVCP